MDLICENFGNKNQILNLAEFKDPQIFWKNLEKNLGIAHLKNPRIFFEIWGFSNILEFSPTINLKFQKIKS